MENIATIEKAQEALSQIHCPTCLKVLAITEEVDRREATKEIEWQKERLTYFRRVAHYIQARKQAVMYSDGATWTCPNCGSESSDAYCACTKYGDLDE
jgi:predicted RNA-binding Zn-ribbon protein involved in translation (DUF1610 family)